MKDQEPKVSVEAYLELEARERAAREELFDLEQKKLRRRIRLLAVSLIAVVVIGGGVGYRYLRPTKAQPKITPVVSTQVADSTGSGKGATEERPEESKHAETKSQAPVVVPPADSKPKVVEDTTDYTQTWSESNFADFVQWLNTLVDYSLYERIDGDKIKLADLPEWSQYIAGKTTIEPYSYDFVPIQGDSYVVPIHLAKMKIRLLNAKTAESFPAKVAKRLEQLIRKEGHLNMSRHQSDDGKMVVLDCWLNSVFTSHSASETFITFTTEDPGDTVSIKYYNHKTIPDSILSLVAAYRHYQ